MKQYPNTNRFMFSKFHKVKYPFYKLNTKAFNLTFSVYGLKALNFMKIEYKHLALSMRILRKYMLKKGKIYFKVFPFLSVTKKPGSSRMGKGKGRIHKWVCPVKPGTVLLEIGGVAPLRAYLALSKCAEKLPGKLLIMSKEI